MNYEGAAGNHGGTEARRRGGEPQNGGVPYTRAEQAGSGRNGFTGCLSRGRKPAGDGNRFMQESFGYHPKMGGYADLLNHLGASASPR
jgi:hypothetical protein